MLKKWLKDKNRRQRLENNDESSEAECSGIETRSESTISSVTSKSSLSRAKRFKASLCLGNTSDSENNKEDSPLIDTRNNDKYTNNKKQEKDMKIKRMFHTQTKSNAWDFFTKIDEKNAQCNICKKVLKNCGNTTNFLTHIKKQHEIEFKKYLNDSSDSEENCSESSKLITSQNIKDSVPEKKSIKSFFKNIIPYDKNSQRKKNLNRKLAIMIARDFQPLSIVEDKGFLDFKKALNPRYAIVSRKTMTNSILPECYEIAKQNLKDLLEKVHSVSLTIDGWTSTANESYLGITCHFFEELLNSSINLHSTALDILLIEKDETANNLSELIRNCLNEWGIFDKVNHIVTDNAANMKLTVELLNKKHFPCFAHSLNLVLKNAIIKCNNDEVSAVITKCKNIVTFFHHSPKATRSLKEANQKLTEENIPGKLIQYVDTRWNTLLYMMNSILANHNGLKLTQLNDEYSNLTVLTKDEIQLIKEIIMILEPFDQATKDISGAEYVSISLVIPCIKGLILKLEALYGKLSHSPALSFHEKILHFIEEKLTHYEQRTVSKVATLIDPRFKKAGFRSQLYYEDAINIVQNLLAAQLRVSNELNRNDQTHNNYITNITNNTTDGIFSFIENTPQSSTVNVDHIVLSRNFLTCPRINLSEEPLNYLKTRHPEIFQIALKYLCTPGSSVPVERLFSASGYIISDRRNRLSPKNVKILTFLNKNYKLVF